MWLIQLKAYWATYELYKKRVNMGLSGWGALTLALVCE